jgi:hypothetical protein
MQDLLASEYFGCDFMDDTLRSSWGVNRNVSQCESPGPVPLATMIRPTMIAATAVAARIVKNQNKRLPSRRKGLALLAGLGRPEAMVDFGLATVAAARTAPIVLLARRCGEIQGQID